MINVSPIKLSGNWFEGFALDLHTISSEFLGTMNLAMKSLTRKEAK